jgi:hypothetical protein
MAETGTRIPLAFAMSTSPEAGQGCRGQRFARRPTDRLLVDTDSPSSYAAHTFVLLSAERDAMTTAQSRGNPGDHEHGSTAACTAVPA